MLCCFPTGIDENANPKVQRLFSIIKILAILQLCLAVPNFWIDIMGGIMMLVGSLVLWCITYNKNWCSCVFYIVLVLMNSLSTIILTGSYFTDHDDVNSTTGIIVCIMLFKLPFYLIAAYYVFLTYREIKALFIEVINSGQGPEYSGLGFGGAQSSGYSQPPPQQPPQPSQPAPFTGRGYRVG